MKILLRVPLEDSTHGPIFYKNDIEFLSRHDGWIPKDGELFNLIKIWWQECRVGSIFEIPDAYYLICVDKDRHSKVEKKITEKLVVVDGREVVIG